MIKIVLLGCVWAAAFGFLLGDVLHLPYAPLIAAGLGLASMLVMAWIIDRAARRVARG